MDKTLQIFCPACQYKPTPEDRWECMPSCGTTFHTFWTVGMCPGCGFRWEKTQCPACGTLSLHKAWYHLPEGEDAQSEQHKELTTHD